MARARWFQLGGSPFAVLSPDERDQILSEFSSLLSLVPRGAIIARSSVSVESFSGISLEVRRRIFILRAEGLRGDLGLFNAREIGEGDVEALRPRAIAEKPDHVVLEDGSLARVLMVYELPPEIPEALPSASLDIADEFIFLWDVIPRHRAIGIVQRARARKAGAAARGSIEGARWLEDLDEISRSLGAGRELLRAVILFTVVARDREALGDRERSLVTWLASYGVRARAPRLMQLPLYQLRPCRSSPLFFEACVDRIYMDSWGARLLYPLASEELVESPGIFLGISSSGSPVVINPYARHNYNIVILGESGSGKSMTAKVFVRRFRDLFPGSLVVGIDPENEYVDPKALRLLGGEPVIISDGTRLGLDPIKMIQKGFLDVSQASDILCDIYSVPRELSGSLRHELARYLEGAVAPPDINLFEGEPPDLGGSVFFGLKGVRSKRLKILASALIASYIYNTLIAKTPGRALMLVDEAWLFNETPSIMDLLENIARRGRKRGLVLLYISQRPQDIASSPQGRALLEQSATTILMRQERTAWDVMRSIYRLDDTEIEGLVNAETGEAILRAGRHRLAMRIYASPEELEAFTTKPVVAI
jgi:hypothetical protein